MADATASVAEVGVGCVRKRTCDAAAHRLYKSPRRRWRKTGQSDGRVHGVTDDGNDNDDYDAGEDQNSNVNCIYKCGNRDLHDSCNAEDRALAGCCFEAGWSAIRLYEDSDSCDEGNVSEVGCSAPTVDCAALHDSLDQEGEAWYLYGGGSVSTDDSERGSTDDDSQPDNLGVDEGESLDAVPEGFVEFDSPEATEVYCANCQRSAVTVEYEQYNNSVMVNYDLRMYRCNLVGSGRFRRKYCNITTSDCTSVDGEDDTWQATLCRKCMIYLVSTPEQNKRRRLQARNALVWPAFIWKCLEQERLQEDVWRLLPALWRQWWEPRVTLTFEGTEAALANVPIQFVDLTDSFAKVKARLGGRKLGQLVQLFNSEYLPFVKCPWGCDSYLDECGGLPIDIIWQRFLESATIKKASFSNTTLLSSVLGVREDFVSAPPANILLNPAWDVRPTILFIDNVPCVATCRTHCKGDRNHYLHPPLPSDTNISWYQKEAASPVEIMCRGLRPHKASTYCDTFCMVEVQTGALGMDTTIINSKNVVSEFPSPLALKQLVSTIRHRHDLRVYFTKIANGSLREKGVDPQVAEWVLNLAETATTVDVSTRTKGATYMPLQDAVELQEHLKLHARLPSMINVEREDGEQAVTMCFPWPMTHSLIHPANSQGRKILVVPALAPRAVVDTDSRLLWFLLLLHVAQREVWESTNQSVKDAKGWAGWFLHFAKSYLPGTFGTSRAYFQWPKKTVVAKTKFIMEKLAIIESSADANEPAEVEEAVDAANLPGDTGEVLEVGDEGSTSSDDGAETVNSHHSASALEGGEDLVSLETPGVPDGTFRPDHVAQLFATHDNVSCVHAGETISFATVPTGKTLVCFYRMEDMHDSVSLEDFLSTVDTTQRVWELSFVFTSKASVNASKPHQWSAKCFFRYGTPFTHWWKIQSDSLVCETAEPAEIVSEQVARNWNFAVYKQMNSLPITDLKDRFLVTMGGQSKAYCANHDVPLVEARRESQLSCCEVTDSGVRCAKLAKFVCYKLHCSAGVCQMHHSQLQPSVNYESRHRVQPQLHLLAAEYGEGDDEDDAPDQSAFELTDEQLQVLPPCETPLCPFGEDWTTYMDATAEVVNDEDGQSEADYVHLPVTETGVCNIPVESAEEEPCNETSHYVPTYVVLNVACAALARHQYKIAGSVNNRHALQRIVSKNHGHAVNLCYPEGTLFPSIFWIGESEYSIPLGAIPSALISSDVYVQQHGIATIQSHILCRLKNSSLQTQTNSRYIALLYDIQSNQKLRHTDSRMVINRGLDSTESGLGVCFDTDQIDSRPVVNKLAAAIGENVCSYFLTLTANQANHFGLSYLKSWMDGEDKLKQVLNSNDLVWSKAGDIEAVKQTLSENAAVVMLRQWIKVSTSFMQYLLESNEHILGDIENMWWRYEFQESEGNLPHIHALLFLRPAAIGIDADEAKQELLNRIRGSSYNLFSDVDITQLQTFGLIRQPQEVEGLREKARKILTHRCNPRCQRRYGPGDGETKCRVPNHSFLNGTGHHKFVPYRTRHTKEAGKILVQLGLYTYDESTDEFQLKSDFGGDESMQKLAEKFVGVRHSPPSEPKDLAFSPCCGILFAATLSSQNLAHPTGAGLARYLAYYLSKIDEQNRITFSAGRGQLETVLAAYEFLHNTKIAGSAINENKRLNSKRDRHHPKGRKISLMEMIMQLFEFPTVYTTFTFFHIQTGPYEERAVIQKKAMPKKKQRGPIEVDDTVIDRPPIVVVRNNRLERNQGGNDLKEWRQLSPMEELTVSSHQNSSHSLDTVTKFGARPSELRWVRQQHLYYRWFKRDASPLSKSDQDSVVKIRQSVHSQFDKSDWIDGFGHVVRVRQKAIKEIIEYLKAMRVDEDNYHRWTQCLYAYDHAEKSIPVARTAYHSIMNLFVKLRDTPSRRQRNDNHRELLNRFVADDPTKSDRHNALPVVWFSSVRPKQATRFLMHVLLSLGEFDCELNLFNAGSMRAAFIRANLLRAKAEDESDEMYKQSLEEDVQAILMTYVTRQLINIPGGTLSFDNNLVAAYNVLRSGLIQESLPQDGMPPCIYAHVQEAANAKCTGHVASKNQQLLSTTVNSLTTKGFAVPVLADLLQCTLANPLLWNAPIQQMPTQTLESFEEQKKVIDKVQRQLEQYCNNMSSQTKSVIIVGGPGVGKTTLMEVLVVQAKSMGLRVAMTAVMSDRAQQLGGEHISKLFGIPVNKNASPPRLAELAELQLLRSPERLHFLRQLDVLFVDEMGTVSAQLLAVMDMIVRRVRESSAFMGGILIVSTFDVMQLDPVEGTPPLLSPHMLTSFTFCNLEHSVTRLGPSELTAEVLQEFSQLIRDHCTHLQSWDESQLPPATLRIFGKRVAVQASEGQHLRHIQGMTNVLHRACEDNHVLAVLLSLPTQEDLDHFRPVRVLVAPNGCKTLPAGDVTAEALTQHHGWKWHAIGVAPFQVERLWFQRTEGEILGRRRQYGLRPRIATTTHGAQGQDLVSIASIVSLSDPTYALWEKAQAIVLLSRTHYAKDIIFVNDDKEDTIRALCSVLQRESHYTRYMVDFLRARTSNGPSVIINHASPLDTEIERRQRLPFRPIDVVIHSGPATYILVSLRDSTTTYIGWTRNLYSRFKTHNQGNGPPITADPSLMPWGLLAHVSGFAGPPSRTPKQLETAWQYAVQTQNLRTPMEKAEIVQSILNSAPWRDEDLVFVRHGCFISAP